MKQQSNICAGGKWTTYRTMAEDCVDAAIEACGIDSTCKSKMLGMRLEGGHRWTPNHFIKLAQTYGEHLLCSETWSFVLPTYVVLLIATS